MRVFAFLLAFVASTFAYQVLIPNTQQGWTDQGGQTLSWQKVSSDRQNFSVVLINEKTSYSQSLSALVDGNLGNATMFPPSAGWVAGDHYRVNLVADSSNANSVLAQSNEFNITVSTNTIKLTTMSGTVYTATNVPSGTGTDTAQVVPTASRSGALATYSLNTGVLALLSLLAYCTFV